MSFEKFDKLLRKSSPSVMLLLGREVSLDLLEVRIADGECTVAGLPGEVGLIGVVEMRRLPSPLRGWPMLVGRVQGLTPLAIDCRPSGAGRCLSVGSRG